MWWVVLCYGSVCSMGCWVGSCGGIVVEISNRRWCVLVRAACFVSRSLCDLFVFSSLCPFGPLSRGCLCFSGVVVLLMLFSALFSFDVPFAWVVVSYFVSFSGSFVFPMRRVADLLCGVVAELLCVLVADLLCVVVDLLCVVAGLLFVSLAICRLIEVFG